MMMLSKKKEEKRKKCQGIFAEVFVDASFATQKFSRSHTGCAVAIGGAFVHCRSTVHRQSYEKRYWHEEHIEVETGK